jgi:predicted DNA-binding transcriptional regulator AlpA
MSDADRDARLLNTAEAAKFLSLSPWWLIKARKNGSGPPFIKIGRAVRYAMQSLLDFTNKNTHR